MNTYRYLHGVFESIPRTSTLRVLTMPCALANSTIINRLQVSITLLIINMFAECTVWLRVRYLAYADICACQQQYYAARYLR